MSMDGTRRAFPDDFKADAVSMVLDDERTIADVARTLVVNSQTLGNWVRLERVERGEREGMT